MDAAYGWFGWSNGDSVWERLSEAAVKAVDRGDGRAAEAEAERALDLARRCFHRGDPRIAASYLNLALSGPTPRCGEAAALRDHARHVLESSWAWLPVDGSRADVHRARELIEQIRALVERAHRGDPIPGGRLDIWRQERRRVQGGIRKVMAAVLLIVATEPAVLSGSRGS